MGGIDRQLPDPTAREPGPPDPTAREPGPPEPDAPDPTGPDALAPTGSDALAPTESDAPDPTGPDAPEPTGPDAPEPTGPDPAAPDADTPARDHPDGGHPHDPNPRAPRRRSSVELSRAVRDGRRVAESLRILDLRAAAPADEDRRLAAELARFLVRRCEDQHTGWRMLRQVLLDGGAAIAWERCARLACPPTADRVLADCAGPGRTPLVRVQHAAAEERARALAGHADPAEILSRLEIRVPATPASPAWEAALVAAVTARSRDQALGLLADTLGGERARPPDRDAGRTA